MINIEKPLIMVVEDDEPLLEAVQKKLKVSSFRTIGIKDGKQVLDYLNQGNELPTLIWLDYYLPSMNGLELLTEMKKNSRFQDIPVFVISNTAGPEKVNAMMSLGVKKYFLKAEMRLEEIIEEIKLFLKKGEKL
jgi:PleD family two-component response regulator